MNKSIIYKAKEDKDIQEDLRKLRALQQEPCDDCICRKHLLEEIASLKESPWFKDDTNCGMAIRKEAIEIVEDLCIRKEPSVNPQEPCEDAVSRQAVCNIVDAIRDCISVEGYWAILERLKKLPSVTSYETGYNDAKREIALSGEYERAYERGKSDAEQPKWIPVSERLPKIATVYRVTRCYPNNVMNPYYLVDACFFDGSNTWYNDNRINHERAYVDNVIAWQENPEPYKESEVNG